MRLKSKKIISLILCFVFTVMLSAPVTAGTYSPKKEPCPRCKTFNDDYGHAFNQRSRTESGLNAGTYCNACKKIVPEGEFHMYIYTQDLYYFMCKSRNCSKFDVPDRVYTKYYSNPPSEHYINGKRDLNFK